MFSAYTPSQVHVLTAAFDRYCLEHAITDELERESVAITMMELFDRGADRVELLLLMMKQNEKGSG